MHDIRSLWMLREKVRENSPIVYNITNNVVTNFTANVLLAAGASPIMSESEEEAADLVKLSNVTIINIGTLHQRQINLALTAGKLANQLHKPVVLDPVGVGATQYRNKTAATLLENIKFDVVRGNYSEVSFLQGVSGASRGVDSANSGITPELVQKLATSLRTLVVATGEVDYVSAGETVASNFTGHVLLQSVTGTGCALSSLMGAFLAVSEHKADGALAALMYYGAAAQQAAKISAGPGTFCANFLDVLANLDFQGFQESYKGAVGK